APVLSGETLHVGVDTPSSLTAGVLRQHTHNVAVFAVLQQHQAARRPRRAPGGPGPGFAVRAVRGTHGLLLEVCTLPCPWQQTFGREIPEIRLSYQGYLRAGARRTR